MSKRARAWTWTAVSVSAAAAVGLMIYYSLVGLDKASTISGIIVSILAIPTLLVGLIALFKDDGSESESSSARVKQSIRSGRGSINIQAGNDLTFGDKRESGERQ